MHYDILAEDVVKPCRSSKFPSSELSDTAVIKLQSNSSLNKNILGASSPV